MSDLPDLLRNVRCFSELDDDRLGAVERIVRPVRFSSRERICTEGDSGDRMFIVDSGEEAAYFFEDFSNRVVADDVLARLTTFNNVWSRVTRARSRTRPSGTSRTPCSTTSRSSSRASAAVS